MSGATLVAGGCVLTLDPKVGNFTRADVLLEGGVVSEVGANLRARGAEVVDASDSIVMPGFVDAHRHVWRSLFRNSGDGAAVAARGAHYSSEDVHAAILGGLLSAIDAGVTTVVDWFDLSLDPELVEAAVAAHEESGVRSVFVAAGRPGSGDLRRTVVATWRALPLTSLAVGATAGDDDSAWELAGERELRVHLHTGAHGSLTRRQGRLSDRVTLVGGTGLGDADFDSIRSTGASLVLTPAADMTAGAAPVPVQQVLDRGIRPGLGVATDHDSPGDLFAQMRAVISIQHATVFDRKLAGKAALPTLLNTREVIRYATSDGARAVGLTPALGTLAPGAPADLVVLRTDRPNIHPINDPIGAVVWGMDTANVEWVFVAGRAVKRAGELAADLPAVRRRLEEAALRVAGAAGDLAEAAGERR